MARLATLSQAIPSRRTLFTGGLAGGFLVFHVPMAGAVANVTMNT